MPRPLTALPQHHALVDWLRTHEREVWDIELVERSPATALLGVDGWADGTAGAGSASEVELNDSRMIRDLAVLSRPLRWLKMRELADEFASAIAPALHEAMARYPNVIVLTHVPPLPEATWHEGRQSDSEYLPHFCNPTLGRKLRESCLKFSWDGRFTTVYFEAFLALVHSLI